MARVERFSKAFIWALLGLFVLGLVTLLRLRFEAGDIYPRGSSLRADPQGSKALYLAFERLGLHTSRNRDPNPDLPAAPKDTAYLFVALDGCSLLEGSALLGAADRLARRGGRVVLLLDEQSTSCMEGTAPRSPELIPRKTQPGPSMLEHWGFWIGLVRRSEQAVTIAVRDPDAPPELPSRVTMPGALAFASVGDDWRVLLRRDERPVAIERRLGDGSMLALAATYPLTNEALLNARSSELLLWLVGDKHELVFDEAHLGISHERGVAHLIEKLHLVGLAAGLLVFAVLFVWRSSAPFCPRRPRATLRRGSPGVPAELVALLRRAVPESEMVATCTRERLALMPPREHASYYLPALSSANDPLRKHDPVSHYNALVRLFSERHRS